MTPARWLVAILAVAGLVAVAVLRRQPMPTAEWHADGDRCTGPLCGNPAHFDDGPLGWREYERVDGV